MAHRSTTGRRSGGAASRAATAWARTETSVAGSSCVTNAAVCAIPSRHSTRSATLRSERSTSTRTACASTRPARRAWPRVASGEATSGSWSRLNDAYQPGTRNPCLARVGHDGLGRMCCHGGERGGDDMAAWPCYACHLGERSPRLGEVTQHEAGGGHVGSFPQQRQVQGIAHHGRHLRAGEHRGGPVDSDHSSTARPVCPRDDAGARSHVDDQSPVQRSPYGLDERVSQSVTVSARLEGHARPTSRARRARPPCSSRAGRKRRAAPARSAARTTPTWRPLAVRAPGGRPR